MNKIDRSSEQEAPDKFNKVMDWGTPRLVTKNRALIMDQKTMQQRAFLHNIAGVRKGAVAEKEEEKKSNFKPVSINNFREKMLQEEKAELEKETSQEEPLSAGKPCPPEKMANNFFNKLRNAKDEEVKSKLRQNIRGLPI